MKRQGSFRIKLIFTSGKVCLIVSFVLSLSFSPHLQLHCFPLIFHGSPVISILTHSCFSNCVFIFQVPHFTVFAQLNCYLDAVGAHIGLCLLAFPFIPLDISSMKRHTRGVLEHFQKSLLHLEEFFICSLFYQCSQVFWQLISASERKYIYAWDNTAVYWNIGGCVTSELGKKKKMFRWKTLVSQVIQFLTAFLRSGWLAVSSWLWYSHTDFCHFHHTPFMSTSISHCFSTEKPQMPQFAMITWLILFRIVFNIILLCCFGGVFVLLIFVLFFVNSSLVKKGLRKCVLPSSSPIAWKVPVLVPRDDGKIKMKNRYSQLLLQLLCWCQWIMVSHPETIQVYFAWCISHLLD